MNNQTFKVVCWPKVQSLMECEGFFDNAYPILDESGMEMFGASAYFVDTEWLDEHCHA